MVVPNLATHPERPCSPIALLHDSPAPMALLSDGSPATACGRLRESEAGNVVARAARPARRVSTRSRALGDGWALSPWVLQAFAERRHVLAGESE